MNELSSKVLNGIAKDKDATTSELIKHLKAEHLLWTFGQISEDGKRIESAKEAAHIFPHLFQDDQFFLFFTKWGAENGIISEEDWTADFDFIFTETGYDGLYPQAFNFLRKLTYVGESAINCILSQMNGIEAKKDRIMQKPWELERLCQLACHPTNLFLGYFDTIGSINTWYKHKKIYRLSNILTEDFIEQDVIFPTNALNNLPFRSFAIDLSQNSYFKDIFDCCFVRVFCEKGNYLVDYKLFDKNGVHLLPAEDLIMRFPAGEDNTVETADAWTQRKFYTNGNLRVFNADLYMLAALAYTDELYGLIANKKKTEDVAPAPASILQNNPHTVVENPLVRLKEVDKTFADAVEKGAKDIIDWERRAKIRSIIDPHYRSFQDVPARYYKKFARFLFCTLFYLCCSNKSNKRNVAETRTRQRRKPKEAPEAVSATEFTCEDLKTATEVSEGMHVNYNAINLNVGEYSSTERDRNRKKGRSRKPHLVRGHFHHYRCGKGRTEVVYKYVEPYYTGVKRKIISVTDIR